MKIVAVKDIVASGEWWEVRYTRLTRRGAKQDNYFLCETLEEAKKKYQELVDILEHHNGEYVSKYEKKDRARLQRRTMGHHAAILKRAVEKAYQGGYNPDPDNWPLPLSAYDWNGLAAAQRYYAIIFDHKFAKAFWGEGSYITHEEFEENKGIAWQYHLQQMVVAEEPLRYLQKFL